jgi:hypothetical protein
MKLGREHLGKIVRMDVCSDLEIPRGVFKEGDIMVLFNNTDQPATIKSEVHSYHSSHGEKAVMEFPQRSLVNVIFVSDDTVVFTVGA